MGDQNLSRLVSPRSVAVLGASDNPQSIGGRAVRNLLEFSAYAGGVYLVNPAREIVAGRRSWPDIESLPEIPDLVVVAVPAAAAVAALERCGQLGVRFAVLFTSGFGEGGGEGREYADRLLKIVESTGMRILGPNCPGLCNINQRIGFTFSPSFRNDLSAGPVGLATQGGGLGRNIMQSMDRGVGIGLWASTGNELDLQVADFIHYMAGKEDIRVIVALLEGIKDGPRFMRAARYAARIGKPVVAFKLGHSDYGRRAAQSHTASLTGSADINSAVFRQLGVVEVDDIDELIDTAWLLSRGLPNQMKPKIAVYCSSGGTAALAADAIGLAGIELAQFSAPTSEILGCNLPAYAAIANPVDTTTAVLKDMSIIDRTLIAVCNDPEVSLVLYPMALDYGDVTEATVRSIIKVNSESRVPIIPVWMSDRQGPGYQLLAASGLPPIRSIGKAVKAIKRWIDYGSWQKEGKREFMPKMLSAPEFVIEDAPSVMGEFQAKRWLRHSGIEIPRCEIAASPEAAISIASKLGYPVVAKVVGEDILHKSDVGGVRLGLASDCDLENAWNEIHANVQSSLPETHIDGILIEAMAPSGGLEMLIGLSRDPVMGLIITCGLGGVYVEVFKDVSRRMLPVDYEQASAMLKELRCYPLLTGMRGQPRRDIAALCHLLVKVSDFAVEHLNSLSEMDLNPVWVGREGQGAYPLDAVIVGWGLDARAAPLACRDGEN
ncbi:CoA-binding protein [Allopusillimonas soli]|uniref:Acetate--CoA ligase family protein n=1 Tax=Allopusillimonas soli TaxID=659016 RepID=A0A853F5V0_9BURK|nr:acetate--CoA ligase family protein [Allopusillimonas soli]TEA76765.1 CoA-binding protein [Allopusillimonas soli]